MRLSEMQRAIENVRRAFPGTVLVNEGVRKVERQTRKRSRPRRSASAVKVTVK